MTLYRNDPPLIKSWRYRALPTWYGGLEHASPMHQDFEFYEDLEHMDRELAKMWEEVDKVARERAKYSCGCYHPPTRFP